MINECVGVLTHWLREARFYTADKVTSSFSPSWATHLTRDPLQPGVTRGVRGHRPDPTSLVYHGLWFIRLWQACVCVSEVHNLDAILNLKHLEPVAQIFQWKVKCTASSSAYECFSVCPQINIGSLYFERHAYMLTCQMKLFLVQTLIDHLKFLNGPLSHLNFV